MHADDDDIRHRRRLGQREGPSELGIAHPMQRVDDLAMHIRQESVGPTDGHQRQQSESDADLEERIPFIAGASKGPPQCCRVRRREPREPAGSAAIRPR